MKALIRSFVAADPDARAQSGAPPPAGIALLFTDIVGSVALSERLGHARDQAVRSAHFGLLRACIEANDGHEVKNLGDGLMVVFSSSADAVEAGIAIQQAVAQHDADPDVALGVRVGIHVGEPTVEVGDYFGRPVAVAKRLCDAAGAGEILVSDLVRSLGHDAELFSDRRDITLKGMADATTTWRVRV
jgi:class 3 adenylate cyclase